MSGPNNPRRVESRAEETPTVHAGEQGAHVQPSASSANPPAVAPKPTTEPQFFLPLTLDVRLDESVLETLAATYTSCGPSSALDSLARAAARFPDSSSSSSSSASSFQLTISRPQSQSPFVPSAWTSRRDSPLAVPAAPPQAASTPTPTPTLAPSTLAPPLSFPLLARPAAKDSNTSDMDAIATLTARFDEYCAAQEEKERERAEKERKKEREQAEKERKKDAEIEGLKAQVAVLDEELGPLRPVAYQERLQVQYENAREYLSAFFAFVRSQDGSFSNVRDAMMLRALRRCRAQKRRRLGLNLHHLALASLAELIGYTLASLRHASAHSTPSHSSFTAVFGELLGSPEAATSLLQSLGEQTIVYDRPPGQPAKSRIAFSGPDTTSSQPVARLRRANRAIYDVFYTSWRTGRFPIYEDSEAAKNAWLSVE